MDGKEHDTIDRSNGLSRAGSSSPTSLRIVCRWQKRRRRIKFLRENRRLRQSCAETVNGASRTVATNLADGCFALRYSRQFRKREKLFAYKGKEGDTLRPSEPKAGNGDSHLDSRRDFYYDHDLSGLSSPAPFAPSNRSAATKRID
jgi:hypothetical protein